jgi:hypothetical protein
MRRAFDSRKTSGVPQLASFITDRHLSVTNLFDNTAAIGMVINNGVFHPRGRSLGLQLTKRF